MSSVSSDDQCSGLAPAVIKAIRRPAARRISRNALSASRPVRSTRFGPGATEGAPQSRTWPSRAASAEGPLTRQREVRSRSRPSREGTPIEGIRACARM